MKPSNNALMLLLMQGNDSILNALLIQVNHSLVCQANHADIGNAFSLDKACNWQQVVHKQADLFLASQKGTPFSSPYPSTAITCISSVH